MQNIYKVNFIKILETLVESWNIVKTFRAKDWDKQKQSFQPRRKHDKGKCKKIKVNHISLQNFVQLPETWYTQQSCWCTFIIKYWIQNVPSRISLAEFF